MVDETCKCLDCSNIRKLDEDELKLYHHSIGWCEGEGGTKTKGDILAIRSCSRFSPGENNLPEIKIISCSEPVKCLNCQKFDKLAYALATPTHHQNWRCGEDGSTKQYEDGCAYRCCSHFQLK